MRLLWSFCQVFDDAIETHATPQQATSRNNAEQCNRLKRARFSSFHRARRGRGKVKTPIAGLPEIGAHFSSFILPSTPIRTGTSIAVLTRSAARYEQSVSRGSNSPPYEVVDHKDALSRQSAREILFQATGAGTGMQHSPPGHDLCPSGPWRPTNVRIQHLEPTLGLDSSGSSAKGRRPGAFGDKQYRKTIFKS